jgi:hypothetical protein
MWNIRYGMASFDGRLLQAYELSPRLGLSKAPPYLNTLWDLSGSSIHLMF